MMTTHDPLTFLDGLEPMAQLERFCQELREGDAFLAAEIEQSAYLFRFDPDVLSFAVNTPSAKEALHNNIDLLQTRLSAYAPGCKLEIHEESPDGQAPLNTETIFEHQRRLAAERRAARSQAIPTEHEEQVRVVQWCDAHIVGRVYAIPNGGTRSHAYTSHLHAEGMRTGAPDLVVALLNGRVLWIELKRASRSKSRVSDAQRLEHSILMTLGHEVHVCYGADEAIAVITAALEPARR